MRIYPHMQDTGGFFITVIEKTSEIRAKPEDTTNTVPKASVAALATELDARKNSNGEPYQKLESLDDLVVPDQEAEAEAAKNASVAQAVHQLPYSATLDSTEAITHVKREADDLEEELPAKRVKLADGSEALIGDRPVHQPARSVAEEHVDTSGDSTSATIATPSQSAPVSSLLPKKKKVVQEEPFKYLDGKHEELEPIYKFYEVSERFPRDRFMVRNAEGTPTRTVYYTSALARDILTMNEGHGMKFVHCGVKMFVKQDAQRENVCRWRIQTDGLKIISPFLGPARSVTLTERATLHRLLVEMFPRIDGDGWKKLGEIGERVKDIQMGCSILHIEPNGKEGGLTYVLNPIPKLFIPFSN
jgi:multisite-specific tRNA:(cytosine-C5)-methyltransferase